MNDDRHQNRGFLPSFSSSSEAGTCPECFHGEDIVRLCNRDQRAELCGIAFHEFLAQDMLEARLQGIRGV